MTDDPFRCRCDDTLEPPQCHDRATQEDGLCDGCRANCGPNRQPDVLYMGPIDGHCNQLVGKIDGPIQAEFGFL